MASLQLTADIKADSLSILGSTQIVYIFSEFTDKKNLQAKLTAAGDTDNMTCTVSELELLAEKIVPYSVTGLTEEEINRLLGEYEINEEGQKVLVKDGLLQIVQAAIVAG